MVSWVKSMSKWNSSVRAAEGGMGGKGGGLGCGGLGEGGRGEGG